ncbi:hypothetical protein C8J57DRAFT_1505796 [Mycena rebaudengoi]|nr:hypothetical protein C8J57DRAFT_1505796 [Mycena rebaudengoi]
MADINYFPEIHPITLLLVKLLLGLLLFVPSYLSALLYISDRDAPWHPTPIDEPQYRLMFIVIGSFFFPFIAATFITSSHFSFPHLLTHSSLISSLTVHMYLASDPAFPLSDTLTALGLLGLLPVVVFRCWNAWLQMMGDCVYDDPDHLADYIVDFEYLTGFPRLELSTEAPSTGKHADPSPGKAV